MSSIKIALLLRSFLNTNNLTLSDLRKAQIYILNGRLGEGIGKDWPARKTSNVGPLASLATLPESEFLCRSGS